MYSCENYQPRSGPDRLRSRWLWIRLSILPSTRSHRSPAFRFCSASAWSGRSDLAGFDEVVAPKNGLRGGQRRYSNLAVRTALTLRVVFSLPLRQTEGFLDSLLRLMGLNLKAPDHTTLSRRS